MLSTSTDLVTPPSSQPPSTIAAPTPRSRKRKHSCSLSQAGIRLLCLDFDRSVVGVHTGGCWAGGAAELAAHIRPCFHSLIRDSSDAGISVAICTSSPQENLIRDVLRIAFPDGDRIVVVGGRPHVSEDALASFLQAPASAVRYLVGSRRGKVLHMAAAAFEVVTGEEKSISHQECLLVDDDFKNVRAALEYGVRSIQFAPDRADHEVHLQYALQHLQPTPAANNFNSSAGSSGSSSSEEDKVVVLQLPSRFRSPSSSKKQKQRQQNIFDENRENNSANSDAGLADTAGKGKQHQIISTSSGRPLSECLAISHLVISD